MSAAAVPEARAADDSQSVTVDAAYPRPVPPPTSRSPLVRRITEPLVIEAEGVLRVTLAPGASERELRAKLDTAEAALATLCLQAGVRDLASARVRLQRHVEARAVAVRRRDRAQEAEQGPCRARRRAGAPAKPASPTTSSGAIRHPAARRPGRGRDRRRAPPGRVGGDRRQPRARRRRAPHRRVPRQRTRRRGPEARRPCRAPGRRARGRAGPPGRGAGLAADDAVEAAGRRRRQGTRHRRPGPRRPRRRLPRGRARAGRAAARQRPRRRRAHRGRDRRGARRAPAPRGASGRRRRRPGRPAPRGRGPAGGRRARTRPRSPRAPRPRSCCARRCCAAATRPRGPIRARSRSRSSGSGGWCSGRRSG